MPAQNQQKEKNERSNRAAHNCNGRPQTSRIARKIHFPSSIESNKMMQISDKVATHEYLFDIAISYMVFGAPSWPFRPLRCALALSCTRAHRSNFQENRRPAATAAVAQPNGSQYYCLFGSAHECAMYALSSQNDGSVWLGFIVHVIIPTAECKHRNVNVS